MARQRFVNYRAYLNGLHDTDLVRLLATYRRTAHAAPSIAVKAGVATTRGAVVDHRSRVRNHVYHMASSPKAAEPHKAAPQKAPVLGAKPRGFFTNLFDLAGRWER